MHRWRALLLRAFGARVGAGVHPYPSSRVWAPWNLEMGAGSCLAGRALCYNVAPVSLGEGAIVSQGAHLCAASHDFDDPGLPLTGGPIRIGAGAWVAAEAFVGPGVTLGDRAVALARAVVVRDVAGGAVVAGNPARVIRRRGRGAGLSEEPAPR
jgi:putative colanic acid biosynthesis acetyltransferase WcaF